MLDGQAVWLVWQHAALAGEEAWRAMMVCSEDEMEKYAVSLGFCCC